MQCDVRVAPPAPRWDAGLTVTALPSLTDRPAWLAILPSWRAAFPPGHPDHFDGDDRAAVAFLQRVASGAEVGPLHPATTLVTDSAGAVVAGCLVTVRSQPPPWGGPWIADIWRDPSYRGTGLGSALIAHAGNLVAASGHASLSLMVTDGNPARRSYERAGFREVAARTTVLLPG